MNTFFMLYMLVLIAGSIGILALVSLGIVVVINVCGTICSGCPRIKEWYDERT